MSSPNPRDHDRSDSDYGMKPNVSSRQKALNKKIEGKKKPVRISATTPFLSKSISDLDKRKGEAPLQTLKRLLKR